MLNWDEEIIRGAGRVELKRENWDFVIGAEKAVSGSRRSCRSRRQRLEVR